MMPAVRRCVKWLLALAIIGAVGITCVRAVQNSYDVRKAPKMSNKMKTVCVGRLLIDVPADARVMMKMASIDGFDVTRHEETPDQFARWISERETKLAAAPNMLGRKNVELNKEVRASGSTGKVLVHSRYRSYDIRNQQRVYHETVTIEGHINKNGVTFSFNSEGDAAERVAVVLSLMTQLVNIDQDNTSYVPGFCLDRALIADPAPKERHESVTMFASFPGHPDITLAFWTNTGLHRGPGLVERDAAATDAITRARSRMLRAGARTISGFAGEEIGVKTTELNFTTNFSFAWETNGSEDNVFEPRLLLELDTGVSPRAGGKPVQSSLTEQTVVQLWEKISSSVRVRPTGPIEVSHAAPPVPPLGTCAEAGERCPQSGWWLCSEGGDGVAVLGGQRQYFNKGQKLPQALLLPPQSLWQKVRGLQPSYEARTRTAWKLVDKRERDRTPPPVPLAQATLAAKADSSSAIETALSCAEPGVSIGCIAKTGMQCPASGWWRCEESHALDGTRWFAAGSLLPAATFEVPPAAFGRAFGQSQAIQRRSVWQLVRHSLAPSEEAGPSRAEGDPPEVA